MAVHSRIISGGLRGLYGVQELNPGHSICTGSPLLAFGVCMVAHVLLDITGDPQALMS